MNQHKPNCQSFLLERQNYEGERPIFKECTCSQKEEMIQSLGMRKVEDWEEKFDEDLFVSVVCKKLEMEEICIIKSFIRQLFLEEKERLIGEIEKEFDKLKVEGIPEKEFKNLPKRNVFMTGQMNVMVKVKLILDNYKKEV